MKRDKANEGYIHVGCYQLGLDYVDLFANPSAAGGSFSTAIRLSEDNPIGRAHIIVGIDQPLWREVLDVLMHEAAECAHMQLNCRYEPNANIGTSQGRYLFVTTHEQFSEIISRTAFYVNNCWHDLWKVWKKIQKKKKRS